MAGYSTSAPPVIIVQGIANAPSLWSYKSVDATTLVDADGYITNAKALGMKVDDIVFVTDTDASPRLTTFHAVTEINTDGSANLSNAGGASDSD